MNIGSLSQYAMGVVFLIVFVAIGAFIVDTVVKSGKDMMGSDYNGSLTQTTHDKITNIYTTFTNIIPLPILVGVLVIAVVALWGIFSGGYRSG